ncbi:MAG: hypothetical protein RL308_20 [Bacteroidota bacterium]|jgi:hypothetical protein
MEYKEDIVYETPYYKLIQNKSVETVEIYHKLINWVSGEFDTYLQDESSRLIIYYPNGWLDINCNLQHKHKIMVEFTVNCKSKKSCQSIFIQLESIYNHICKIYGYNKPITYELQ